MGVLDQAAGSWLQPIVKAAATTVILFLLATVSPEKGFTFPTRDAALKP